MKTYGQGAITLAEFCKEVRNNYRLAVNQLTLNKLYKKGLSVDDAVSYLIMKS